MMLPRRMMPHSWPPSPRLTILLAGRAAGPGQADARTEGHTSPRLQPRGLLMWGHGSGKSLPALYGMRGGGRGTHGEKGKSSNSGLAGLRRASLSAAQQCHSVKRMHELKFSG